MHLHGLLLKQLVYLKKDDVLNQPLAVAVGINRIQGYESVSFYLGQEELKIPGIEIRSSELDSTQCFLHILDYNPVWSGTPYLIPISEQKDEKNMCFLYLDVTNWILRLASMIINIAYDFVNVKHLIKDTVVYFSQINQVHNGLQLIGYLREGQPNQLTKYSVEFVLNFSYLPKNPMIGRVADVRIGYFYNDVYLATDHVISGTPTAIINRKDLNQIPWNYIVDNQTIPIKYHQAIKYGVLSWNQYFRKLGLGKPLKVILPSDSNYPKKINVFETDAWYITATQIKQFNGPYSGFGCYVTDYRSGQNLYGIISLNLLKIASYPVKYLVFNGLSSDDVQKDQYIEQFLSWVVAHEVGHQLGLRHNFMGSVYSQANGSIMDYFDIFADFTKLHLLNISQTNREYDMISLDYGYRPLVNEVTGVKHPQLDVIANRLNAPFGSDENLSEGINPLIGVSENVADPLRFVEQSIESYRQYRVNLIHAVMSQKITSYEYNTMFIYLYTQKYPESIHICLKYLGGRLHNQSRTQFEPIDISLIYRALSLLLHLLIEIEYTPKEYAYIIYDYDYYGDRQLTNRLEFKNIYAMNVKNLFYFYQNTINHVFKQLLKTAPLLRLLQNDTNSSPIDTLYNFTFAYQTKKLHTPYQITKVNGIFAEIGAFLAHDNHWTNWLMDINHLKYNRQYSWLRYLLLVSQENEFYPVKESVSAILTQLKSVIQSEILPIIETMSDTANVAGEAFWQHPKQRLLTHWTLLSRMFETSDKIHQI